MEPKEEEIQSVVRSTRSLNSSVRSNNLFRKRMTYEDYGHLCADSLLPELVEQPARIASQWAGSTLNSEAAARQLAILCLAFHQFCHIGLLSDEAGQRVLQGMMSRFDERFPGFSSDRFTSEATTAYLRAAASDIKKRSKSESFPTLVPTAIARIAGLTQPDPHWHSASATLYSILEVILETAEPSLVRTQKHAKLV